MERSLLALTLTIWLAFAALVPARAQGPGDPVLVLTGAELVASRGESFARYRFDVANKDVLPADLFAAAPTLPPCGNNSNSSRTWVDFFAPGGKRLYGFCSLREPADLDTIWFALPEKEAPPAGVYIILKDRLTGRSYKSNIATISAEALVTAATAPIPANDRNRAYATMRQALALKRAGGAPVPLSWYRSTIEAAYAAQRPSAALALASGLLADHASWENARLIFPAFVATPGLRLDALRLMRLTRVMKEEAQYCELAAALVKADRPAEAKAVLERAAELDEADLAAPHIRALIAVADKRIKGEILDPAELRAWPVDDPSPALKPADTLYAAAQFQEAAVQYRVALGRGRVDPNLFMLRYGAALVGTGKLEEAKKAFAAAEGGYGDLAAMWLIWLQ
ncbi:tetratricopeptide repeat protein [Sphingosinicella rhizophila]|uniref:Tetratricopeptide repeat protein n=1 Tax=Sphingosinicella rhizophila TaxID=3050082 RepID=A0ABU3Q9X4_9SPHN|nr:hypothetical protein [Sphingosinicella sp. GR2756]MDT9600092.1 hypothetical protein [Sphingosinicella sp. GR2756]